MLRPTTISYLTPYFYVSFFFSSSVTATASTPSKLSWLLSMNNGATHAANYKSEDFSAVAKTATNGKGVDVIVDPVGQSHWHKNIDSLAMDGRMTLLAFLSGKITRLFILL